MPNHYLKIGQFSQRPLYKTLTEVFQNYIKIRYHGRRFRPSKRCKTAAHFEIHRGSDKARMQQDSGGSNMRRFAQRLQDDTLRPSKARKSWTMLELGLSVAGGQYWMGIATIQTPVLYIDFEFLYGLFSERRNKILKAKYGDMDIELPFYELVLRGYDASFRAIKKHIESFCREKEIGLIIFDPVYKLADDFDENKAKDVAALLREFEKLAASLNAAIAFAHHFAKGNSSEKGSIDRASGSGVWAREPDALLMITPLDDENYTLEMHLRNFPQKPPVAVFWNDGVWEVNPNVDVEEEIVERVHKPRGRPSCGVTANDLKKLLESRNESSVSQKNLYALCGALGIAPRTLHKLWKQLKGESYEQ